MSGKGKEKQAAAQGLHPATYTSHVGAWLRICLLGLCTALAVWLLTSGSVWAPVIASALYMAYLLIHSLLMYNDKFTIGHDGLELDGACEAVKKPWRVTTKSQERYHMSCSFFSPGNISSIRQNYPNHIN